LPEKNSIKKVTSKKALHIILSDFCSDFLGFCEGFQIFCPDFQGFSPDFKGFCPEFPQIKTFGDALAPPALPPPTPVVAHKIGVL